MKLWPRLCFYMCLWFCSQGGSPGRPPSGRENPPRPGRPPWDQTDPPRPGRPPRTRQTPPDQADSPDQADPPGPGRPPPDQADTLPPPPRADPPRPARHPPRTGRHPLPRNKTAAYGQWAAGTHPTGMHSCYYMKYCTRNLAKMVYINPDNFQHWHEY